ncbi:NlpC/P60 family protein [Streptomyces sp. NPDC008139]|uniref:C40 family peptidase n=1 Tax=Streptomyces sp. NPDC008139 TaxID=3364814 RepID=UPI0036EA95A7
MTRGIRSGACAAALTALTALTATVALTTATATAPAQAAPPRTLAQVRAEVDALYRQAEAATDAYNAAGERVRAQQHDLVALAVAIDRTQTRLRTLTAQAGALARAQYRAGGVPDTLRLAMSGDPDTFLSDAGLAARGARAASATIDALADTRGKLDGYAHAATERWQQLVDAQRTAAGARQRVRARLAEATALLATLKEQERVRLARLEDEAAYRAQSDWLATGDAKRLVTAASTESSVAGRRAVAFATRQIGKPYVWGAAGPSSYDCSGLTSQAWAAAGRPIPRTSQEQWARLPHVPVDRMRPGDLVIYFSDASHVGIYVGGGAIVHAPRPGRDVVVAGAGSMPILGVVRPG